MDFKISFWHYISSILLNDHLLDSSGFGGDPQFGIDIFELFFRLGCFPHVECFTTPLFEGCCDPALLPEYFAQALPAFIDSVLFELPSYHLYRLVGQNRDKQVAVAAVFQMVIDWAHPKFGFQTPKH